MYQIASIGKIYNHDNIELPPNVVLKSIDRGVVHTQLTTNGMHFVVVPTGKGNTVMMRRVCVGGSRLEDPSCAGAAHVIEHMDFRNMDWNAFGGISKNASTCATHIVHEAEMLLHPQFGHLEKELQFQKETMLAQSFTKLRKEAIFNEIQNVRDEGMFNNQKGSGFRAVVEQMNDMMLQKVWSPNANTKPTIGTDLGLSNIQTSKDLLKLHHMLRTPNRTFMVMCGPIDVNKTLNLLHNTFYDVPKRLDHQTRPIPASVVPAPARPEFRSVTLNSGNRFINIGGVKGAYNADTDVMLIMQHLCSMLGAQPQVQQNGVHKVCLYFEPEIDAGSFSLVAQVSSKGNEQKKMKLAQKVLETAVIAPLLQFNDDKLLHDVLQQYNYAVKEALQSGPQQCSALAVQGILACGKPSLAWHVDDRFNIEKINSNRVRQVAANMFHPNYIGIVHCTAHSTAAPQQVSSWNASCRTLPYFHVKPDTSHLAPNKASTAACTYVRPVLRHLYNTEHVLSPQRNEIATVAYNTVAVEPLSKRALTCCFGTPSKYGGWAKASLLVAALNTLAQAIQCYSCKYKLENQQILATVETNPGEDFEIQSMLQSLSLAAAVAGTQQTIELNQIRAQLPQAALHKALENVKEWYDTPSQKAMAQTRSQLCKVDEDGFIPENEDIATKLLSAEHQFVVQHMLQLFNCKPKLAATNICRSHVHKIAKQLHNIQQQTDNVMSKVSVNLHDMSIQIPTSINIVHKMSGLHTFPYVASIKSNKPLSRKHRAALLVSNHVMCGGMGAHYTHSIRQKGRSYRPSGGVKLSWINKPILMLHATFDNRDKEQGQIITQTNMQEWCTGKESTFSTTAVNQAKESMKEQILLDSLKFESQKYSLLACLDPNKYSSSEVLEAVDAVSASDTRKVLQEYFGEKKTMYESWVI